MIEIFIGVIRSYAQIALTSQTDTYGLVYQGGIPAVYSLSV